MCAPLSVGVPSAATPSPLIRVGRPPLEEDWKRFHVSWLAPAPVACNDDLSFTALLFRAVRLTNDLFISLKEHRMKRYDFASIVEYH